MCVQETSKESYQDVLENLGARQEEVLTTLSFFGEANNTMLSKKLNLPINSVVPRINELRKKGLVVEAYKDFCPYTKKRTIFWKINASSAH